MYLAFLEQASDNAAADNDNLCADKDDGIDDKDSAFTTKTINSKDNDSIDNNSDVRPDNEDASIGSIFSSKNECFWTTAPPLMTLWRIAVKEVMLVSILLLGPTQPLGNMLLSLHQADLSSIIF